MKPKKQKKKLEKKNNEYDKNKGNPKQIRLHRYGADIVDGAEEAKGEGREKKMMPARVRRFDTVYTSFR